MFMMIKFTFHFSTSSNMEWNTTDQFSELVSAELQVQSLVLAGPVASNIMDTHKVSPAIVCVMLC